MQGEDTSLFGCFFKLLTVVGSIYLFILTTPILLIIFRLIKHHLLTKIFCFVNLKKKYGKWAVVTGGTDGIGKSYARELARRGVNIVIISRNIDKLNKVAKEIEKDYGVETKVIQIDFSEGKKVYENLPNLLKDLDIGILVNNVGVIVPYPQLVTEMSDEQIWQHVNVNVASLTIMTRLVLPGMQQRRRGAIVNLSSMAALAPLPYLSVYAATKAYVDSFSEALRFEYRRRGIEVQTVCPGYVNTQMLSYSEKLREGGLIVPSAELYAKSAVSTLGVASKTAGYWVHDIQYWLFAMTPKWLWIQVAGRLNKRFRAEYDATQAKKN